MNIDRPNRFRLYTVSVLWLCLAILGSGCSSNTKTGLHSYSGTTATGGNAAQGGSMVSGGSADQGGNGGKAGAGGASSSSTGISCYDSSGAIATTAKTCTLASDCKQIVRPASNCCGAISVVGLAQSSSCTFPTPPCDNVSCPIFDNRGEQAEDGNGGTIGVQCAGGQCMTFVMADSADAAADTTGGATSAGGGAGGGGTQAAGGATGTGGSTSISDGSTTDLDTCSGDADCTSCNWGEAPIDSSHCAGTYCCGGPVLTKKRCDANQAAWAAYCPGQSPPVGMCPCLGCPGQSIGCVNGQCGLWCHFPDAG